MAIAKRSLRRVVGLLLARLPEAHLEAITDARHPRGRRWKNLGALVRLTLVAMLSGRKSFAEAEALSDEMAVPMRRELGLGRRVPDTTLRTSVSKLEPKELRASLRAQVRTAHRRKALAPLGLPFGEVAIDGKSTALGAWDDTYAQRQPHSSGPGASGILRTLTASLVSSRAKVCLDANPIPPSTNEMGHFATALKELLEAYQGLELFRLISTDAGMCSQAHGALIAQTYKLHYLFGLKGDQPTLYSEAQRLLGRRRASQAQTVDVVGKCTVTRQLYLTEELAGYLDWTHLQTVVRVHTEKHDIDTGALVEHEDHYYLSSLPSAELSPEQWLLVVRRHWGVENDCHNTWDKIFREDDRPWFVSGEDAPKGALVVLLLRRIAYNLLALFRSVTQRSEDKRQMPWHDLLRWVYHTFIAASASDLQGLRRRQLPAASVV